MRKNVDTVTLLAVLLLLLLFVPSCSPKPKDVVISFQEAYNSHDLERALSLFAETASFEVKGVFSLRGEEEIRDLAEHDFVLKVHMAYSQFNTRGDSVMCQLTEKNDWLKMAGIQETRYSMIFVVKDGLIQSVRAEAIPESERAYKLVSVPFMNWAAKQRPQLLAEMMPEGTFVYNEENARKSLSLLREWKQLAQKKDGRPAWRKLGE